MKIDPFYALIFGLLAIALLNGIVGFFIAKKIYKTTVPTRTIAFGEGVYKFKDLSWLPDGCEITGRGKGKTIIVVSNPPPRLVFTFATCDN